MGFSSSILEPTLTEKNLPDQQSKVFIVTGATSGVGKELAKILYAHHAKVYLAGRSPEKATTTIQTLKDTYPASKGEAIFLKLDLDDLSTIRASAEEFLSKEEKLDVLWNNAGVMWPPRGSKTKQEYELQLGTNTVAPFLFTKLLAPVLSKTAKASPAGSVRVVWVSSSGALRFSPEGGIDMGNLDNKNEKGDFHKYAVSKAGNILHSKELAKRYRSDGIISVALDPGNLNTGLYRSIPRWQASLLKWALGLHDPINGAYTELFAGLSSEITLENLGAWIEPWGQIKPMRKDIERSSRTKAEGGTGVGDQFWAWCEEQVRPYV